MFDREVLIKPIEPFAIPMYAGRDNHYPNGRIIGDFLNNLERVINGMGIEFPTSIPIAAGLTAPIDEMTDIHLTLIYMPHHYPVEKVSSSNIFIGSPLLQEINSMHLSAFGSPSAHGDYKGRNDEYETRYWVTDAYIVYLQTIVNQLDENGLFVPCPPAFRYSFITAG